MAPTHLLNKCLKDYKIDSIRQRLRTVRIIGIERPLAKVLDTGHDGNRPGRFFKGLVFMPKAPLATLYVASS